MENKNDKKTCILCKNTIKTFSKWKDKPQRRACRKCWLGFREFSDRHFDWLFTGNYKQNNKLVIIKPK